MNKNISKIINRDSKCLSDLNKSSIGLVVTSPPYPMIAMWDEVFSKQDNRISQALKADNGSLSFELMHQVLQRVWSEIERVLIPGGIACINIGDATRSIGSNFQLFDNRSRIVKSFIENGMQLLPNLIWRKPDEFT